MAAAAGISRQTLNVAINEDRATSKTVRLIAGALRVDPNFLISTPASLDWEEQSVESGQWEPIPEEEVAPTSTNGAQLEEWISNLDRIVLTLRNFPGGEIGQRLKIGFLNAVEDIARETGNKLPMEYYSLRKRVQDGEL